MRIKKVSETTPIQAQVVDNLNGSSTTDAPSQRAVKEAVDNNARNYMVPIKTLLLFYGNHQFVKNEWRDIINIYSFINEKEPLTPGCTRWYSLNAWTTDNSTGNRGLVIGLFTNNSEFRDIFFDFGYTWGTTDNDWGNYKGSSVFIKKSDIPDGWMKFKSIMPDNATNGTAGRIRALYLEIFDVPNGITPTREL